MKTNPTLTPSGSTGTHTAPRRAVNPFANDAPHPDPRDLLVAAGRPTICRHPNPMGCHRERRIRRGRRRPGRRRYRGIFPAGKMLQAADAFGHHIEHHRACRQSVRSATILPVPPTSDASP
jgi:hypothetical protein